MAIWLFWVVGTVVGLAVGGVVGSPQQIGLDGVMPALFLAVLIPQLRAREALASAALAAGLGVAALCSFARAPIPVVMLAAGMVTALVRWLA